MYVPLAVAWANGTSPNAVQSVPFSLYSIVCPEPEAQHQLKLDFVVPDPQLAQQIDLVELELNPHRLAGGAHHNVVDSVEC